MTKRLVFIFLALLMTLIPLGTAYAQSIYSVDIGTMEQYSLAGHDTPNLVRWPTGVLHIVYAKQFGAVQEIYWAYSVDGGLNWIDEKITNVGVDQYWPSIALSSNGDLHVVWYGDGNGAFPLTEGIKYIHGDYDPVAGTVTWGSIQVIANDNENHKQSEVHIDGNDNLHVISRVAGSAEIEYTTSNYDYTSDSWGSWSSPLDIATTDGALELSMAIDKDNKVGIVYINGNIVKFRLRQTDGTWGSVETVEDSISILAPVIMASISGGDTVWRVGWFDPQPAPDEIKYKQKTGDAGAWGAETVAFTINQSVSASLSFAQEHGTGGDTGDFYLIAEDGLNDFRYYAEFQIGVGWQARINYDITVDGQESSGTGELFPYDETNDWHWNFPVDSIVIIYSDPHGVYGTGDEEVLYFESANGWLNSSPMVITNSPYGTRETYTNASATITMTGGYTITSRGFRYGLTQTPTWIYPQTGTFGVGDFGWIISSLLPGTVYYIQAYATSVLGTGYGEWIGFLTAGGGGSFPAGGVQVTTTAATAVLINTATINGDIVNTGTSDCTIRAFDWGEDITYGSEELQYSAAFGTGAYSADITGLVGGVTYHFRAKAYNASGWSYGADMEFTTPTILPEITALPATYITMRTAQLNAYLDADGGEACSVRFQYLKSGGWDTANNTPWIPGYVTGNNIVDAIGNLTESTEYTFRAQAFNSVGNVSSGNLTFMTLGIVNVPTNFTAIPQADEPVIDLSWVKGNGTALTMVRAKIGNYPGNTTDGTLVALTKWSSFAHEGLIPGTTYYYRAWGQAGNETSASYAQVFATTTSGGADRVPSDSDLPASWFFDVDHTNLSGLPFYSVFNMGFNEYGIPLNTGWFILVMLLCTVAGMAVYGLGQMVQGGALTGVVSSAGTQSLILAIITMVSMMVVAASMRAVPGLYAILFCMIAIGIGVVVRRM